MKTFKILDFVSNIFKVINKMKRPEIRNDLNLNVIVGTIIASTALQ